MISLSEIVLRLRAQCPAFTDIATNRGRVGGVAAFEDAQQSSADFPVPHCFVFPLYSQDVTELLEDADLERRQMVRQYFATIVCVDNSSKRGSPAKGVGDLAELDQLALIQEQLTNAFQGWKPIQRFTPIRFHRDLHLISDNKRLWHQFEWYLTYTSDPTSTTEQENAVAEILDEMDAEVPYAESILANIRNIYATYTLGNGVGENDGNKPDTWDDFWGHRFCPPHASPQDVSNKIGEADMVVEVLPNDVEKTMAQVREAITLDPTPITEPPFHGVELTDGGGI